MTSNLASASTSVFNQIRAKILMSGPITVADYMKLALFQNVSQASSSIKLDPSASSKSNPQGGYYMGKDVFGAAGDFTTNPEISQMFGEMVGIWGYQTWAQIGGPKNKVSIVEMGPGRGTMAKDILRVFRTFLPTPCEISLHLVEISPFLASMQAETLCGRPRPLLKSGSPVIDPTTNIDNAAYYYQAETSDTKVPIFWYRDLMSVPKEFQFYIAHEFFDVLPIHKLQRVEKAWREVLVDLDEGLGVREEDRVDKLRYVISRHETPSIRVLQNLYASILNDPRQNLEVSLEAIQILEELCSRLETNGGFGLIVDYGNEGTKDDTFRGFFKHKVVDPLQQPGEADLTADVDFSIVKKVCQEKALLLGTIKQQEFLRRTGIGTRARTLYRACQSKDEKQALASAYKMLLTDLGEKFHCLALLPKVMEEYRPKLKILAFDN